VLFNEQRVLPRVVQAEVTVPPQSVGIVVDKTPYGLVDIAPIERFVSQDTYIKRALGSGGAVQFGDKPIGPSGRIVTQR
jgi:hypothetical protein